MWRQPPGDSSLVVTLCLLITAVGIAHTVSPIQEIGGERAIARHLLNGDEHALSLSDLLDAGRGLFTANWTDQDAPVGRSHSKGLGPGA
jgi:hypothetical protein